MPLATGAGGKQLEAAMPVVATVRYGDATPVDGAFFVATRAMRVTKISARVTVAGTDGGAVTAQVRKAPSGTATSAGTVLHSGTINMKGTADTNQALTLTATPADLSLAAGDALCLDVTGTTTNATGVVSVELVPLA